MKGKLIYWNGVFVIIIAIMIAINAIAISYDNILRVFLGSIGTASESFEGSSFETTAELRLAQEKYSETVMSEGSVLLKNDNNALPLNAGIKISLFGQNSVKPVLGGTGSGLVSSGSYGVTELKNIFESADISVNNTLWEYYENHNKRMNETGGDYKDYESKWIELNSSGSLTASFSAYNDAAIVFLSRLGSEAADLPQINSIASGGNGQDSYLSLTPNERDMLAGIKESGVFKKIIVVLNSGNAVQLDFLSETKLGVDACLLFGMPGVYGLNALPDILLGKADPSGHLNDTYVYNSNSAPSTRNFGDERYTNTDLIKQPDDTRSTVYESTNYGNSEFSYVNYAEGIYVGYKYYETRYEDYVLNRIGVGNYDYDNEVYYPFGYGKSYTDFEWSGYSVEKSDDMITVTVTVKNIGKTEGKDVVQIYAQAPYLSGGVEKASVNLVGFTKTKLLKPDEREKVSVTFNFVDSMKSYDNRCVVEGRKELGAYILDSGIYYVTAAKDAHQAINNIILKKFPDVDLSRMSGDGDADFVDDAVTLAERKIIHNDLNTGKEIVNLFDDALAPEANDETYLSRSNWRILDEKNALKYSTGIGNLISKSKQNGEIVNTVVFETRQITETQLNEIKAVGWDVAGRPESANDNSKAGLNTKNGKTLLDAKGKNFNAPIWDEILKNLTIDDLKKSFLNGAFSTIELSAINKPATVELDGPSGITNYTNGHGGFGFPSCSVLARTFNIELADLYGKLVAEDGLRMGVYGWYAPCININRTPFTARSYESYSEDGYLTGEMASAEINGCHAKGMYVYVKHFALNEQGTNRNYVCTWGQEQAFREIYFKPFEMCVKNANATGIMASMNRIGYKLARGNYNLLTGLLKSEWGFNGAVVTDAITYGSSVAHTEQALAAGVDLMLNSTRVSISDEIINNNYVVNRLLDATHRVCYMVVNSGAMDTISSGVPIYRLILIVSDITIFFGICIIDIIMIKKYRRNKELKGDEI